MRSTRVLCGELANQRQTLKHIWLAFEEIRSKAIIVSISKAPPSWIEIDYTWDCKILVTSFHEWGAGIVHGNIAKRKYRSGRFNWINVHGRLCIRPRNIMEAYRMKRLCHCAYPEQNKFVKLNIVSILEYFTMSLSWQLVAACESNKFSNVHWLSFNSPNYLCYQQGPGIVLQTWSYNCCALLMSWTGRKQ